MNSSIDEITRQGGKEPSRKEPTLNPPPKIEKSAIGVTSNYILNKRYSDDEKEDKWYVLRIRYNHDEDAYKELLSAQIKKVYFATHQVVKLVHGKRKKIKAPLIPGLLFAFSSRMELDYFMFGKSPMAVHVRYYRNRSTGKDEQGYNDPVTVPELEMDSFMKICDADNPYVQVIPPEKQQHIRKGDWVRVVIQRTRLKSITRRYMTSCLASSAEFLMSISLITLQEISAINTLSAMSIRLLSIQVSRSCQSN